VGKLNRKEVEIIVYGTDELCASCVNLPSSKETYEWLQAAVSRKFANRPFSISYVDIYNPPNDEQKRAFANKVIAEELFYPVVLIGNKIVGEGNPKLKTIYAEMEKYGYKST
jgi:disulfide oxidoreductase YuzD